MSEVVDGTAWQMYLSARHVRPIRMRVTPTVAAEMLAANIKNRNKRPYYVRQLADRMLAGDWTDDHPSTIAIGRDGEFFDGQHRMFALVAANVTAVFTIVFGCDESSRLTVDAHRPKTLADRLWISDRGVGESPYEKRKAAELAVRMMAGPSNNKNRPDGTVIADFLEAHRDAAIFTLKVFGGKWRGPVTGAPVKSVIARAYYHVNLELLRRFVDVLLSGEADLSVQAHNERAIILARNWLLEGRHARNSNVAGLTYRRVSRALEAYVNNEPLKILKDISYDPYELPERGSSAGPTSLLDRVAGGERPKPRGPKPDQLAATAS